MKICKLELTHIGRNFPCHSTQPDEALITAGLATNVDLVYGDGTAESEHACGQSAEFEFKVGIESEL